MNKEELIDILSKENGTNKTSEENMLISYIKTRLDEKGIKYSYDIYGNIYSFVKDKPLFCCHTDSMKETKSDITLPEYHPLEVLEVKEKIIGKRYDKRAVLGGDDACGVFIVLNLIEEYGENISFAFFSSEETGMWGSRFLSIEFDMKDMFPYTILLDRMGNSDIICTQNGYGSEEFEGALFNIGEKFGYKPNKGFISDADTMRKYSATANISCGYFNAHSEKEYVIYEEVVKAYNFCEEILKELGTTKFPLSNKRFSLYLENSLKKGFADFIKEQEETFYGLTDGKEIFSFYKDLLK